MSNVMTAVSGWGMATWTAFAAGLTALLAWVPKLIGALLILAIGWGLANVAYRVTERVLDFVHFDRFLARTGINDALARARIGHRPADVIATIVKWVVVLVTVSVAADALGLPALSAGVGAIIAYVPNVIAAVVIAGLGLLLAGFVRDLVRGGSESIGMGTGEGLGTAAYWVVAVFAALGAIGQLKIAPALVQTLYTGVIGAAALAAGLAFGLGLRDQARDLVAGRSLSQQFRPGDEISVEGIDGKIQRIGMLNTTLATRTQAVVTVPNRQLVDHEIKASEGSAAQQRLRVTIIPPEQQGTRMQPPGSSTDIR